MDATQNSVTDLVTAASDTTRRLDGKPESDADRRFFAWRDAGYTGPIDQDGFPVIAPGVTPASTLRAAARYLAKHGWVQGYYYDPSSTVFTPAACLVGALGVVCYGGPVECPAQLFDEPGFDEFEAALAFLDLYVADHYGPPVTSHEPTGAYDFNDAKDRTAEQVIGLLHEAADAWYRQFFASADQLSRVLSQAAAMREFIQGGAA